MKHINMLQNRDVRAFTSHSQWSLRLWQHNSTLSKDGARAVTEMQALLSRSGSPGLPLCRGMSHIL
jgi:hypothetical protein